MKSYLFLLLIIFLGSFAKAQTIEDVQKLNLTETQLRNSFENRQIILTHNISGKKKKLKEGAFALIKLKGDTLSREVVLEAFLTDSIIVSTYKPQLDNKEINLGFSEFQVLPFNEIEVITYSVKHRGRAFWGGFLLTLIGVEFVVLPVVMPMLIGNTEEMYSKPSFPYMIGGGVVLYILGRRLTKSLRPKEYNLSNDWQYQIIKK